MMTISISNFNPIRAVCPGITLRAGGGRISPPPRSQLVVVRFSKSWTLRFPTVLRNSHAKFYQNRTKNTAPAAPQRKSARATPRL